MIEAMTSRLSALVGLAYGDDARTKLLALIDSLDERQAAAMLTATLANKPKGGAA